MKLYATKTKTLICHVKRKNTLQLNIIIIYKIMFSYVWNYFCRCWLSII